ncbi:hypothetical protein AAMO2058_001638300 [Amorphochlora amoebiformis]
MRIPGGRVPEIRERLGSVEGVDIRIALLMAVTLIAYNSVFFFLGAIYLMNGVLLYSCSWNGSMLYWASHIYGKGKFTMKSRINSHLQRNSAILMFGSSLLNMIAATTRSKSTKRVASYWNYVIITHYTVEMYTGQIGGSTLVSIYLMLLLILYYEHREENMMLESQKRRRLRYT